MSDDDAPSDGLCDMVGIKGVVTVEIIDAKTGEVIDTQEHHNILTTLGRQMFGGWLAGTPPLDDPDYNVDTRLTAMAVGDGSSTPAVSQTALDNELLRKELYPTPDPNCEIDIESAGVVAYKMLIDETELNGETLRELALFSETFTDFMVSRLLVGNLSKTSAVQFRFIYRFTVTNCP